VSYEVKEKAQEKIDITSDSVKDRWSRYIGAMGIEAVAKQAESRVLLCELGALSVEIAKNIVLAGCKELVIFE
jgi:molybdopterin/thiamine biosynthesis adenylyltransferase